MRAVSYDTETTGLCWYNPNDNVFAFSTCDENERVEVHRLDGNKERVQRSMAALDALWSDTAILKVMHNAKFDILMTEKLLGRKLHEQPIADTLIMSHLLQSKLSHRLKDLAWELAGISRDDEKEVLKYANGRNFQVVPEFIMTEYQKQDAMRTMLLYLFFNQKLQEVPSLLPIYELEIKVLWHTIRMEQRGIRLLGNNTVALAQRILKEARASEAQLETLAGRHINPNSSKDVVWLLQKLGVQLTKLTEKAQISTDKEVLMGVRMHHPSPEIEHVLKYRAYAHAAPILIGYLRYADANGDIHPSINTMGAVTGRESCREPNLQNVSKEESASPYPVPARRCFGPRLGFINFHIDFSGIEIRLIAHFSEDAELIRIISTGLDPHMEAAAEFYGDLLPMASPKVKKMMRNAAKNGNYAVAYGASAKRLSSVILLPIDAAKEGLKRYRTRFPGVAALSAEAIRNAYDTGFITTAFGRRIYTPQRVAYKAANYLIQGTAADILKYAFVRVAEYLQDKTFGEARILLPIHDELVIEYPRRLLRDVNKHLKEICDRMTYFPNLKVPMATGIEVSTNTWADTEEWHGAN